MSQGIHMGYFSQRVGRPVAAASRAPEGTPPMPEASTALFAAQVGKCLTLAPQTAQDCCPRCLGTLAEEDGLMRCGGRCGGRWVRGGSGRWLDPATLPFGLCACCRPRVPLVRAEVGAICPQRQVDYLILPEGIAVRAEAAPLGICRCCLPPQPLVQLASGLVCRNKPQQYYQVVAGEIRWVGAAAAVDQAPITAAAVDQAPITAAAVDQAPITAAAVDQALTTAAAVDQATITAAIDAALRANSAELTLFGLFVPPSGGQ